MINSEIIKEYGLNAGASVVGIAASKDFVLAPEGRKPLRRRIIKFAITVINA